MVRGSFFSHVEPNGVGLFQRLRRVHYIPGRRSWGAGENLGFGEGRSGSPLAVMTAWMHSSPHRANILYPGFREVGFGIASGVPVAARRGATITSDFGYRR
jgi:uncharacterized protein YkwD